MRVSRYRNRVAQFVFIFCILPFIQLNIHAQAVRSIPQYPTADDTVSIVVDIKACENQALLNYTGDVYVHTGVYIKNSSIWEYVIASWNQNLASAKCKRVSDNVYEFSLNKSIKSFYGVADDDTITSVNLVFRSSDGSLQTEDLFIAVYQVGLSLNIRNPQENQIYTKNDTITLDIKPVFLGTPAPDSINVYIGDSIYLHSTSDSIFTGLKISSQGLHTIKAFAYNKEYTVSDSVSIFIKKELEKKDIPYNLNEGINIINDSSAAMVLYAPGKEHIFAIGDFNNWQLSNDYQLYNTPDGKQWWIIISDLDPEKEYAFQYFIDDDLKIADPYVEKILDPWNDPYITEDIYPGLKDYPADKTTGIVGIIQTKKEDYRWQVTNFSLPSTSDLVIYEIHIKNFTKEGTINKLLDTLNYLVTLGVNAIELMPFSEFEGNVSWGYNPSFYFALDKAYGTNNDLKSFIDTCHKKGIAVIQDMVLNHAFGQCPLVQLYWDEENNRPSKDSPWFNITAKHESNVGFDFNHESGKTRDFAVKVLRHWLKEYNIDGFRFDLSKGFTQKNTLGSYDNWAAYDASRINTWKNYADSIRSQKDDVILILEHFADNTEETVLANYGFLLWNNMNYHFNEATMGYNISTNSNFSWAFSSSRGWTKNGSVVYMESHDEERLMYKNLEYGNSSSNYNIKEKEVSLQRMETAAAFFFAIPGPKMIWEWGELGYDYSINRCTSGDISNDCRLDLKPVAWDYYNDTLRYRLYKVFEALIDFKQRMVANTISYSFDVSNSLKYIKLNSTDTDAVIIGNFGVTTDSIQIEFQHTGYWFDYSSQESINLSNADTSIVLKPGEYRIFTDKKFEIIPLPQGYIFPDDPVEEDSLLSDFSIYPNPVYSDEITFQIKQKIDTPITIEIYSYSGQRLLSSSVQPDDDHKFSVDISQISRQVCIIRLKSDSFFKAAIFVRV